MSDGQEIRTSSVRHSVAGQMVSCILILVWPSRCTSAVGDLFVFECVCVREGVSMWVCESADMSNYCSAHDESLIMKHCVYAGYHDTNNVSNVVVTR